MPRIRSDDGPRTLRDVYLGPPGWTLWVEWTYVRWIAFLAIGTLVGPVILIAVGVALHPILGVAASVMFGTLIAFWVSGRVTDSTNFNEPLIYKLRMLLGEVRRQGDPVGGAERISIALPPIGELSPGARRALR